MAGCGLGLPVNRSNKLGLPENKVCNLVFPSQLNI